MYPACCCARRVLGSPNASPIWAAMPTAGWASLAGDDGRTVNFWVDRHHPYIEVFTGDTLAADRRRRGIGCEPMACPPNAFATGLDVLRIEPGESVKTMWGVRLE